MDQNQTVDNDLQKAIDDITKTTNTDPIFSNPTFTEQLAPPIQPIDTPEPNSFPPVNQTPIATTPEENQPPVANADSISDPTSDLVSNPDPTSTPALSSITNPDPASIENEKPNTTEIKKAALRDLVPILDRININPSQKFRVYKDIFEDLKDTSVIDKAYQAAKELSDETERAEALLYLVEAIDKM